MDGAWAVERSRSRAGAVGDGARDVVGLGLALAQPERRVIVLSGDGSLLMNLGTLITISAQAPPILVVIVFVNSVYEVTGAR
jgi:thiamine pyrophosphate-dependent acetolactate synthase large subunit-like protein